MDSRFTVTFEGDHVRVLSDAEKNLDYANALWPVVAALCEKHNCYNVLGISNAASPMPTFDAYSHAELFRELGIDSRFRIAWAELNVDAIEAARFAALVLTNRSLPGAVFSTEEEARQWLFADIRSS